MLFFMIDSLDNLVKGRMGILEPQEKELTVPEINKKPDGTARRCI